MPSRGERGSGNRAPVARARVAAGAAVTVLVVAALVGLTEGLRHPASDGDPVLVDDAAADPRIDVECPEPQPREGVERDQAVIGPPEEVVAVSSNDLYDCPSTYDGRMVRYQGEAVGAALGRRDGAWVQVNDDVYADLLGPLPAHREFRGGNAGVGVLLPRALADRIAVFGGPDTHGDLVEVVGVFHRVDPQTREVAVIRAGSGEVLRRGQAVVQPRLLDRRVAAALLGLAAVGVVAAERLAARRR